MDVKVITNILLEGFYILTGLIMIFSAFTVVKDTKNKTRFGTATFWFILAFLFIVGKYIPFYIDGLLIIAMGVLTATKQVNVGTILESTSDSFRESEAQRIGNKIFIPSISIAVFAFLVAQFTPLGGSVAIGASALGGLILALIITKTSPKHIPSEGDRLLRQIGPTCMFPQLLAALGALFTAAGVGEVIASGVSMVVPEGSIFFGVLAYCLGMVIFTIIMGNGFAAFTVITTGVGVPFVFALGGDPGIAAVIALTACYCGTLITPMAANFNMVPAALLDTKNKYQVIYAQIPVAIVVFIAHVFLMYWLAF